MLYSFRHTLLLPHYAAEIHIEIRLRYATATTEGCVSHTQVNTHSGYD